LKDAVNEVTATVLEELPNALYRVELENQQQVLAHPVGTVKRNFVRLRPGDRVRVALSPHDLTRGRIVGTEGGIHPARGSSPDK